ncbi:MAG: outer membrane lipoprotein carrier protein LolA [Myxococcales bacterium]|nr:outer membrane lipoprotein carrier protein LolA [Myxococcales bacterium]
MICSSSFTPRFVALALAALIGVAATPAAADEPVKAAEAPVHQLSAAELDAFLARFAAMPGLSAKFREEKTMALLAIPLFNEGVIYFASPGRLARHTTAPVRSSVIIDGERMTFGDSRGVDAVSFDQNPILGLFVTSFVKIFAGDKEALAKMYAMELRGDPAGTWALKLRPQISPMDQVIAGIELVGDGLVVKTMTVDEVGGDRTVTTFTEVNTARRFSDAELKELFKVAR